MFARLPKWGGGNGAVVLGGSRDFGRETGQNAMWCRVVMRGAKKGVFGGVCGGMNAVSRVQPSVVGR